jgi:GNAT superfamily N-acetyltransferase
MTYLSVTFRTLTKQDLPELEASFPEASPHAHKNRLIKQQKNLYLYSGAIVEGKIAAIQLIRWNGSNIPANRRLSPYPEIGSLFVLPAYRRQGIAASLLEYSEAKIKKHGDKGISLAIQNNNDISIRLHIAHGYVAIGPASPKKSSPNAARTYYFKRISE